MFAQRSAADALLAGEDHTIVRRRLELLAEVFRMHLCDPEKLVHACLAVQGKLRDHLLAVTAAEEGAAADTSPRRVPPPPATTPPPAVYDVDPWCALLQSDEASAALRGWDLRTGADAERHAPRWQWRAPLNLYSAGPHAFHLATPSSSIGTSAADACLPCFARFDRLCLAALRRLLFFFTDEGAWLSG